MADLRTFVPSPQEQAWGLCLTAAGASSAVLGPPERGWRLIYLVRGGAALALPGRRRQRVEAGDAVLLDGRSGATLAPSPRRGCSAHFLDFEGAMPERWAALDLFGTLPRVIRAGFDELLMDGLVRLRELAGAPQPGAGLLRSGVLAELLARLEVAGRRDLDESPQKRLAREARRLLADPESGRLNLEAAAAALGVSYSWFRRCFRAQTGLAPHGYRLRRRLEQACRMLADTALPVGEVAAALGFSSQAYFARMFRKETGLSPSVWRAKRLNLKGIASI